MSMDNKSIGCLNCERSEREIPLIAVRYEGDEKWICSQCLPLLIHKPHQLAGKLRGASRMEGAPDQE